MTGGTPMHQGAAQNGLGTWHAYMGGIADRWRNEFAERKQERSRKREREIMRGALVVFARDGVSRARMSDIANEAGIPISSLYEYFPGKEDIAQLLPIRHITGFFDEYVESTGNMTCAQDLLRHYLWLAVDYARRNPDWARVLYLEIWPSVMVSDSPVRACLDDYMRALVKLIQMGETTGEWPAGPDRYETAAILNASINQLIITWLLYRKPGNLMNAAQSIVDRTMTLLGPRPLARH